MSMYSDRLQPALQNLLKHESSVLPPEIVIHDTYIGGRFRRTKITRKASDAAENLQLYGVVWFFHPRSSCTTTHISADIQRRTLNASRMTISGGRNKQLDIFCRITGFTSDFLSFIVVELIPFFHRALQFILASSYRAITADINHSSAHNLCTGQHITSLGTLSNAFSKCTHPKYT